MSIAENGVSRAEGRGPGAEGQTFGGASVLARYANLVKLPHTVFALPFALVGTTMASRVAPVRLADIAWIVVAFTCARFAAMGFNRIADRCAIACQSVIRPASSVCNSPASRSATFGWNALCTR